MVNLHKIIKYLAFMLNICLITGCVIIRSTGVPKEKIKGKYQIGGSFYKMNTSSDGIVKISEDIGMCGSGIWFITFIPMFFANNICEKNGFRVQILFASYSRQNDTYLKYNGKIYKPSYRLVNKDANLYDKSNPIFKIKNFKEFKKAKDKTIIIMEDEKVITEIPFEWKLGVIL